MECEHSGEKCWCHLDWHCEHAGLARVFGGSKQFGDPYCYALPFVVRERFSQPDERGRKGLVEFVGVVKVMTPCQYRALRNAMRAEGWGVLSTRVKGGEKRTIEIAKHALGVKPSGPG